MAERVTRSVTSLLPFRPRGTNGPRCRISMTSSSLRGGAGGPTAAQEGEPRGGRAGGGAAAVRARARRARGQGTAFRKTGRSRAGTRVIGTGTTGESSTPRNSGTTNLRPSYKRWRQTRVRAVDCRAARSQWCRRRTQAHAESSCHHRRHACASGVAQIRAVRRAWRAAGRPIPRHP